MRDLLWRDSDSGIADLDDCMAPYPTSTDSDPAAHRRELKCIVDKVLQRLAQSQLVCVDPGSPQVLNLQSDTALMSQRRHPLADLVYEV